MANKLSVFDLMSRRDKLLRTHLRAVFYTAGIGGLTARVIDAILDLGFVRAEKEYRADREEHAPKLFKRMQKKVYKV